MTTEEAIEYVECTCNMMRINNDNAERGGVEPDPLNRNLEIAMRLTARAARGNLLIIKAIKKEG